VSRSLKSAFLTPSALWAYRAFRRSGLLDKRWCRKLFLASYFAYKRCVEDSFDALAAKHAALFEGGHILDIGANVGYTTNVFSRVVETPFKVFAFEPEPENFAVLRERFGDHHLVEPVECAVGDEDGSVELLINAEHPGDHRILTPRSSEPLEGVKRVATRMVRIDSFAAERGIDENIRFVKIDVQGYELPVCRGMQRVIERSRPAIALEYAPYLFEETGYGAVELMAFMRGLHYSPHAIGRRGELSPIDGAALGESLGPGDYRDLLFLKDGEPISEGFGR